MTAAVVVGVVVVVVVMGGGGDVVMGGGGGEVGTAVVPFSEGMALLCSMVPFCPCVPFKRGSASYVRPF